MCPCLQSDERGLAPLMSEGHPLTSSITVLLTALSSPEFLFLSAPLPLSGKLQPNMAGGEKHVNVITMEQTAALSRQCDFEAAAW